MFRFVLVMALGTTFLNGQVLTFKFNTNNQVQYDSTISVSDTTKNIQDLYKNFIIQNYTSEEVRLKTVNNGLIYNTFDEIKFGSKAQGKVKCWHYVEITRSNSRLTIIISQIKLQSYPEINTPDPKKEPIEDWYRKYLVKINKGKQAQYHADYLTAVDEYSKKLIIKLIDYYQLQ